MDLKKKSSQRINPPAGTHVARLQRVIDMGTQYNEKYESSNRYIDLTWELVDEKHVFDEEKGEQPFVLSRKFTQNIGAKATLGKFIKSWMGKEPADDFDINQLFNEPCMVTVIHNDVTKDGEARTYANVDNVTAVPKGMEVTPMENNTVIFDLDDFDQEIYETLPEFMRDIISASDEYKAAKSTVKTETVDFLDI